MSEDRELLEMAARAGGRNWRDWTTTIFCGEDELREWPYDWNPIDDDGDAFRLSVELQLIVIPYQIDSAVCVSRHGQRDVIVSYGVPPDPYLSARRAITLAAAEIGRAMP